MKRIDLTNRKFGRILVLRRRYVDRGRHLYWQVRCDCGNETSVRGSNLQQGNTKSCGCLSKEILAKANYKHGMEGTPTYNSWESMKSRCLNVNAVNHSYYGGRGIKVCGRWLKFENFLADMGERPQGMTLDRINNDGNYELKNCKWSSPREQRNNVRNNVFLTNNGLTLTISQWARKLNIKTSTLDSRIRSGWSIERALCESIRA